MAEMEMGDALLNAARHGFADELQAILSKKDKKANVSHKVRGRLTIFQLGLEDHLGNTPLHLAAGGGHAAAIEAILPFAPDVNAANNLGDTPLHKAALRNHVAATRALVKAGANSEKKNNEGKRPRELTQNGDVIAYLSPADEPDDDEDDKKKKKKDSDSDSD